MGLCLKKKSRPLAKQKSAQRARQLERAVVVVDTWRRPYQVLEAVRAIHLVRGRRLRAAVVWENTKFEGARS
jgi:hypothetical protein